MKRPRALTRVAETFDKLNGELLEELYRMFVIGVQTIHPAPVWQLSTYWPPGWAPVSLAEVYPLFHGDVCANSRGNGGTPYMRKRNAMALAGVGNVDNDPLP